MATATLRYLPKSFFTNQGLLEQKNGDDFVVATRFVSTGSVINNIAGAAGTHTVFDNETSFLATAPYLAGSINPQAKVQAGELLIKQLTILVSGANFNGSGTITFTVTRKAGSPLGNHTVASVAVSSLTNGAIISLPVSVLLNEGDVLNAVTSNIVTTSASILDIKILGFIGAKRLACR